MSELLLSFGSRYKHGSRKTFKWNISDLSHFSSLKLTEVLNKEWQLLSALCPQGISFEYLFLDPT